MPATKSFCDSISRIFELTRAELGVSVHSNFYCRSPQRCLYWVGSTFLLGHSRTFTELSWSHSCVFLAAHWNRNLCHSLTPGACLKRFSLKPPSIFFGSPCHRKRIPMLGMMLLCLNVKVFFFCCDAQSLVSTKSISSATDKTTPGHSSKGKKKQQRIWMLM